MNIRCPHCQTLFRVDPERIPARGVRARCARCSGTFRVEPRRQPAYAGPAASRGGDGSAPRRPQDPRPAAAVEPRAPSEPPAPPPPRAVPQPAAPPGLQPAAARGDQAPPAAQQPTPAPASASASEPAPPRPRPSFGRTDPEARAQRLARALVSDIVAYHPDKVEESRRTGSLRGDFREEIMKSWEEYVAQVGEERAKGTPFFREALNDILAQGQTVF